MRPADDTFETKTQAEEWLTLTEAEILEDDWIDPDAGEIPISDYAATWIEERPGPASQDGQELSKSASLPGSAAPFDRDCWRTDPGAGPPLASETPRLRGNPDHHG